MVKNQRNSCCHMGCPPMIGDLHFHRGYSLRLQESKPLKNNGIISTPAPGHTARVVYGSRVLLLPRAGTSLENVARLSCRLTRTVRGHRYVSRSQRTHCSLPALVVHTAREPQEVFGAALLQMHQHLE